MMHFYRIRAGLERHAWLVVLLAAIVSRAVYAAPVAEDVAHRALAIEASLYGYPQRALLDLKVLMARTDAASPFGGGGRGSAMISAVSRVAMRVSVEPSMCTV